MAWSVESDDEAREMRQCIRKLTSMAAHALRAGHCGWNLAGVDGCESLIADAERELLRFEVLGPREAGCP